MRNRIITSLAVLALAVGLVVAARAQSGDRPNIVIILADDYGYGSAGCYGADPKLVRTPNIDRLAREGRRFTDAHTTSSVCSPTRYALMTGRYAWRTSLKQGVLPVTAPLHIETTRPTLASLLKQQGYTAAAIGKWHLGYGTKSLVDYTAELKPGPLEIGFDYHFALSVNHGDVTGVFIENHGVAGLRSTTLTPTKELSYYNNRPFMGLDAPQRDDPAVMETLTDKAVAWLGQQSRAKPFFLYFTPVAVHEPITPSKQAVGSSAAGPYGDFIHDLDASVGRLLAALDKQGLANNTLVLFTSDNGGVVARAQQRLGKFTAQAMDAGLKISGDLRGGKHTIFQGGFNVPYLVRWPGRVPAGTVSAEPISLVDTFATLSALTGVKMPAREQAAEDSYNVLPAWLGKKTKAPLRPHVIVHSADGTFAIRAGKWKWIEGQPEGARSVNNRPVRAEELPQQLYDLAADRAEKNNLLAAQPEVVQRLAALLNQIRQHGYSR